MVAVDKLEKTRMADSERHARASYTLDHRDTHFEIAFGEVVSVALYSPFL